MFNSAVVASAVALAVLGAVGCSESTTRKDVASAQQKLDAAKQKTSETAHDAQTDIANAQQNAREHTVAKPVTPDDGTAVQQNDKVADAQLDANQKIANAKEKEAAAAANLKTTEQQFQETQQRDAFVKEAEQKLADYDRRIDELKQQASTAEGANKDAINRQIDAVKGGRDRANNALSDLKKADLASWKNHQDHVRMAFQDLDKNVKNVR